MLLTVLPIECVVEIFAHGVQIDGGNKKQIKAHAEVSECQIAHEEFRHRQLRAK